MDIEKLTSGDFALINLAGIFPVRDLPYVLKVVGFNIFVLQHSIKM